MVQAGWSGSCSAASADSGSAAAGTAAAAGAGGRSWSPSAARSSHPSDLVECIGGILTSLPVVWDLCTFCYGVCHLDSWDGFALPALGQTLLRIQCLWGGQELQAEGEADLQLEEFSRIQELLGTLKQTIIASLTLESTGRMFFSTSSIGPGL